jgi:uncharacterized protein DUF1579
MRVAWCVLVGGLTIGVASAAGQGAPPMPKPGPEHELFKMDVGTWDAVVEFTMAPGQPPVTSKGVEVNTLGCGGLCSITDFKGEAMGTSFHGHGMGTWDATKKKYVGSWTDSMSAGLSLTEGTWDPAKKRFTGTMEGPDMTGKVMKTRSVVEYREGTRVMTAYAAGPDGKEMQVLKITYTKRK